MIQHTSLHHSYDSFDCQLLLWFQTWFNIPLRIIAVIHMTVNHGYDSSHDFHTPQNIMVMIYRGVESYYGVKGTDQIIIWFVTIQIRLLHHHMNHHTWFNRLNSCVFQCKKTFRRKKSHIKRSVNLFLFSSEDIAIDTVEVTLITFRTLSHHLRCSVFTSCAVEVWSVAITWWRTWKPSATLFAGIGLLASMHVHVKFKFVWLRKRFATKLTNAWLLLGVCSAHVAIVRCVGSERFATVTAFKWFLTAVLSDVSP